ncbi:TPA: ATP-grasp domain-containing protein, partial [Aeromonas dhakensis]|nr:ATP-grasp domain-containing protein [Aeromonas dhakensis]
MILPPATLGMLGGGQLGRYFVMAAHRLGYKVVVLDPDPTSIAGAAADHHIVAAYDDPTALHDLASRCAAVTCEFENVPATALALLEQYQPVRPAAGAVRICQDRREEKAFLSRAGIPVAPNLTLQPGEPLPVLSDDLFPAILKTAREGYDGKGQWTIHQASELPAALATSGVPCVLEKRLPLEGEFSLTLARSPSGAIGALPLVQNWHSGGILDQTRSPANVPALEADARRIAKQLIAALDYVGVLTVEFFLVAGKLLVNELAPRPHNSGHPSLDNAE